MVYPVYRATMPSPTMMMMALYSNQPLYIPHNFYLHLHTYGTRPIVARVFGRDRTPNETDSAIMTVIQISLYFAGENMESLDPYTFHIA